MSVLSRSVGDIVQLWSLLSVLVDLAGLWSWSCENGLAYVTARSSRVDVSYLERPLLQSTPCHPRRHYDTCPTEAHWNGGRDAAAGAPRAAIVHRVKATTTTTAVPQPAPPPHAAAADNDDKPAHNDDRFANSDLKLAAWPMPPAAADNDDKLGDSNKNHPTTTTIRPTTDMQHSRHHSPSTTTTIQSAAQSPLSARDNDDRPTTH